MRVRQELHIQRVAFRGLIEVFALHQCGVRRTDFTEPPSLLGHDLHYMFSHNLERNMGFEPMASSLARKRSTAELIPHLVRRSGLEPLVVVL